LLIKTALSVSEFIEIGLTSEDLLKNKKYGSHLESFEVRKKKLKDYIASISDLNRVNIVTIKSWEQMTGYALDPEYEALVVSQETYENGIKLNETREKKGMIPLILVVIPMLKDKDNRLISSTNIREKLE